MNKVNIIIDKIKIRVSEDLNLWQAAKAQNILIPALCYMEEFPHTTSCMVCMVWDNPQQKLIPSCSVKVEEGMDIETNNQKVQDIRKSSIELLLAEHLGDCIAPCQQICPAHPHIPQMIRNIRSGQIEDAFKSIKKELIFPLVLGYICSAPCETGCRRNQLDSGISICRLHRLAALNQLDCSQPFIPESKTATGKNIAVIGAGPSGLAGAFTLSLDGHKVTLFEQNTTPGGSIISKKYQEVLSETKAHKEIQSLLLPAINLNFGTKMGKIENIIKLKKNYDAVLITIGKQETATLKEWNFDTTKEGIQIKSGSFETSVSGIFAAGSIIKENNLIVKSVAQGKEAARSITEFLNPQNSQLNKVRFNSRMRKIKPEEIGEYFYWSTNNQNQTEKINPELFNLDEAVKEAYRCFSCDCKKVYSCKLRETATEFSAAQTRTLLKKHKIFKIIHGETDILFEPGKCIKCGICIKTLSKFKMNLPGLSFINRGFEVILNVPFSKTFKEALGVHSQKCIQNCPTSALSNRNRWEKMNE